MHAKTSARRRAALAATQVSRAAGVFAIVIALSVLGAWCANAADIATAPEWVYRMNPMTGVCLALSGAAICLARRPLPAAAGGIRLAIGFAIAAIGATKLIELAMGWPPVIDLLLFAKELRSIGIGMMSLSTAAIFALVGASLVLVSLRWRGAPPVSQALAAGALTVATAGAIAYLFGAIELITFPGPGVMSFQSAVALVAISIGVLWIRPRRGVTGVIIDRTLGGITARRLLPIIFVITVGLGGLRVLMARASLLDEVSGISLLVAMVVTMTSGAVLIVAHYLRRTSLRLAKRERTLERTAAELLVARDSAASAARARADFIANVSHEIRNPLMIILASAERLARRAELDSRARTDASRIDAGARALSSVVNDVLDFSKLEAGQVAIRPGPVDPAALVAETASMFEEQAAAKKLKLGVAVSAALPQRVMIDAERVRQILFNLISNAIKFTETGSVHITATYDARSGRLRIGVEDTGAGIGEEERALLFQRFSQVGAPTSGLPSGTGLGLAICKGLVGAMNGEIGVDTKPGDGSTFHISIPAEAVAAEVTAA